MPWRWRFRRKRVDEPSKAGPYLALVESQADEVRNLVARLEERRPADHFREAFEQALGGQA